MNTIHHDLFTSTELIFRSKLTWLLLFGPIALIGKTGIFGESTCFVLAGLTLIPLAERLSFVTEEVAEHTNQTIGALLNATFGNAPELLISAAALQEGFYRVVQLTLLGSMMTNLLFVFGLSCLVGGLRFQTQELRIVSGNASIGMLMLAVAGMALPAALLLSDEMVSMGTDEKEFVDKNGDGVSDINDGPTQSMVQFSRFNAAIMITGYLLYLLFQLGSHSDEFEDLEEEEEDANDANINGTNNRSTDEEDQAQPLQRNNNTKKKKKKVRKNKFCRRWLFRQHVEEEGEEIGQRERGMYSQVMRLASIREMEASPRNQGGDDTEIQLQELSGSQSLPDYIQKEPGMGGHDDLPQSRSDLETYKRGVSLDGTTDSDTVHTSNVSNHRRRVLVNTNGGESNISGESSSSDLANIEREAAASNVVRKSISGKSHCSDGSDEEPYIMSADITRGGEDEEDEEIHMSFRAGLLWLLIITLSISAMSDILVDTIDGFAFRYGISEVFTSLIILPYFSNIAEQVSALIFAYRNEMDLCIGITVGSAVQIALFVLPGSVLIGWAMDRSMSLFFRGFETCCLIFSVVSVAAVLQGGTTNWLVGCYLLGVYFMIAAGFWFHEVENLSIDGEALNLHNHTTF